MAHQVPWTKLIVEEFIKDGMLSKEEEYIIRTRAAGHTITQQAEELHMSTDNVSKIIARLKKKYDIVEISAVSNQGLDKLLQLVVKYS